MYTQARPTMLLASVMLHKRGNTSVTLFIEYFTLPIATIQSQMACQYAIPADST